ncbi:hypothetical protein CA13_00080 [Planctomycetes bacterium CA13]|uniref:Uncharacterized protein n=1 Tax=Novipirellula herctigrandis TaxID=2527986 RepID=A0A5C5YUA8_9BACT|nr:hypothetical protein CA13_00080 [Planctomycetes bacterium CA13]
MLTDWAMLQQTQLNDLSGSNIECWRCTEMAFESADETNPVWRHPSVNAIQCAIVDALIDGRWRRFYTLAGDAPAADWGVVVGHAPAELEPVAADSTIYRNFLLSSLPCGAISSIYLDTDSCGMVGRIELQIGNDCVSLAASEVYDNGTGGFRIADYDESILVQLNNRIPGCG